MLFWWLIKSFIILGLEVKIVLVKKFLFLDKSFFLIKYWIVFRFLFWISSFIGWIFCMLFELFIFVLLLIKNLMMDKFRIFFCFEYVNDNGDFLFKFI